MSVFGYKLKRVWRVGPPGRARTFMKRVWRAHRVVVDDGTTYAVSFEMDGLFALLKLLWRVRTVPIPALVERVGRLRCAVKTESSDG